MQQDILDSIKSFCVLLDIGIITIAYPILIETITNLGSKYNSPYLNQVFFYEFPLNKFLNIR
jgi:hypothetical protein